MTNLRHYIENRREEIKQLIAELKQELTELALAEKAITTGTPAPALDVGRGSSPTIKEMVLEVLEGETEGATAQTIIELINNRFGEEIARPSLSPQLSRLKEEGYLALDGRTWRLTKYEYGPPTQGDDGPNTLGGGIVREQGFPSTRPEGANPSTSTELHQTRYSEIDEDDLI
jgi:hypothetical protein